uniref:Uncharacterized protein n=1 Tax=Cuerna arida TaxID=1464854 RepID=A0A1B6H234_9HEMI
MALRLIFSNRLPSFTSKRMYQPFLHMRSLVKCNSSLYQSEDLRMNYYTFQHYSDGSYKLINLKTLYSNQTVRYYAKSRDKKKSDKGHKKKVQINEEVLAEVINVAAMHEQMQGAIEKLKNDFIKNLSLRSTSESPKNTENLCLKMPKHYS